MTQGDYLAGTSAQQDIRREAKTIVAHLQTLDYYDWLELLRDFTVAPGRVARIFPIERGGNLVSSASVFIGLLSDQSKEVIARAATAVLSRPDAEDSVARTIITLATLLRIRIEASVLDRYMTGAEFDASTRSAAAALLATQRHDPRPEYWERLPFDSYPELVATAASALAATDPMRAAQLLRDRQEAPAPVSTFEYPLRKLLRRLPGEIAHGSDVLRLLPSWLQETAAQLLSEPEFRLRFGANNGNVVAFPAKEPPAILAEYTLKKAVGLAWFPENGDIATLVQASEWCQLVSNVAAEEWSIRIRPSHYYEGRLFAQDESLPSSINAYSAAMAGLLIDTGRRLSLVNGGDPEYVLDPKRAEALESVVDDIYALKVLQVEPGFGSRRRGNHGTIVAVGDIAAVTLLVPAKFESTIETQLGISVRKGRRRPVSIHTVLRYCVNQSVRCYVQPSTALYDELKDEYDRSYSSADYPFKEETLPVDIRDPLLRAHRQKQYPRAIALVDVLAAPQIIEKTASIKSLPAAYAPPLPVGFLIPKGDPLYADRVLRAIYTSLYSTKRNHWNADFRRLMRNAKVRLFDDGPQHFHFSGGKWVHATGAATEDATDESVRQSS